jgi:hypothetical protein
VFFSVAVDDPQGSETMDSVFIQLYAPLSIEFSWQGRLRDDGTGGDRTAGDGRFSAEQDLSSVLTLGGIWRVRFQAKDIAGLDSWPLVRQFYLEAENSPPVIEEISAPDTVSRNAAQPFLMTARVSDPQGSADIVQVAFNSYKPEGFPSSGNPFIMKDDGTQGDADPGDGVYSITVTITSQNETGDYRFEFFAVDQSNEMSILVNHWIHVKD